MKGDNVKKSITFIFAAALVCMAFVAAVSFGSRNESKTTYAAGGERIVTLEIGNPVMSVDGNSEEIDPGKGTAPVIVSGRTFVPIRAIIEALGGEVEWNNELKETLLKYDGREIRLVTDSVSAYIDGEERSLDAAPTIIDNRTMLPIRFIAEGFDFDVEWDAQAQTIKISTKEYISEQNLQEDAMPNEVSNNTENRDVPAVYMTSDISPNGIMAVYDKLGFVPEGNVAVKLSTGEAGNTHYLDPNLIKDLVLSVDGTIVECNTAYGGSRAETALHKQIARDHGFTEIANVDIMDEDGSIEIPIENGENISVDYVGKNLSNYGSMITLSHFKGHAMGGFGGAIKNMSIGVASREGKNWIHTAGKSRTSWTGGVQDNFLESMAEATSGVVDYFDGKIVYINVMNNLSVDCDCSGNPAKPEMSDVGILASTDPVALDQACVDIVYNTPKEESGALIERIESRNGIHTLEHAEKIGLGSRKYELVNID